jgi:hypothetical protein
MSVVFKFWKTRARANISWRRYERNWATPIIADASTRHSLYTSVCMLNAGLIKLWTEMRRKLNLWKKAIDVVPPRLDFLHFEFPGWCQRNKERPFFPTWRIDRFFNGKERKIKVSTVWDEIDSPRFRWMQCLLKLSLSLRHKRIGYIGRNWVHWCNNSI